MLNTRKEAIGLVLICVIGLLTAAAYVIYDRLPQDAQYHNFSDNHFDHQQNADAFHRWLNQRKIY